MIFKMANSIFILINVLLSISGIILDILLLFLGNIRYYSSAIAVTPLAYFLKNLSLMSGSTSALQCQVHMLLCLY